MLLFHHLIIYALAKHTRGIMPSPFFNLGFLTQEIDSNPITDEVDQDRPKNDHITKAINFQTQDPETICNEPKLSNNMTVPMEEDASPNSEASSDSSEPEG